MANIKSSKKRANKSEKQRKNNMSYRSMLRTFIKKVNNALLTKNKQIIQIAFKQMQSVIDKQVRRGLIHKNKASRHKSRLHHKINNI
ncbi:30S ribosomal protein S20 [Enterobacteriaceae endosymbiont of Plateumaris consimilis]|uniref:30S ribosomal protein S20 n=1 Tax=Enterobacteriaceae endosymbiont of Plateumaris consimilis TaxID=2675794 RepID=UPI001448E7AF|nr:30S ribosomal protein S20 [Enterobacteriaceae endosymbiont of Plateumaris consimilis]QJC28482.1 30S ribosomal protein S20 [Enterobacteriaceae endosymbiont of Plateumaris consimilis]